MKTDEKFYNKDTVTVAKDLLGCFLVHESDEGTTVGKIVETEAYVSNDPGNHAFIGRTKRNEAMFGPRGTCYVYQIYGIYFCFNIVTNPGEAVLIRALEPVGGIELMKERRGIDEIKKLCNGPSKLAIAMGITQEHNKQKILSDKIYVLKGNLDKPEIVTSRRVGLNKGKDMELRFYIKNSSFISKK